MLSNQYYRYPVGYGNKIYMVSHETLWSWSEDNGLNRWALLKNTARDLSISTDGKYLAFTGSEESDADVYVMELDSHQAIRKTFFGKSTYVVGWYDKETVIYATNYELPFRSQFQLFKLNIVTNKHEKIPCGHASRISWNSKNQAVIQRFGYGYNNWREYKGGTIADLWIQNEKFEKLPFSNSNALNPIWVNDNLYFLSDVNGCGNIYQYNIENKTWSQSTTHDDFYVKDISKYGEDKILYSKGGDIYCLNTKTNEDTKLIINGPSHSFEQDKFYSEENGNFLTDFDINNKGSEISCAIRGKIYSRALWNKGHKLINGNIRCRISLWNQKNELISIQDDADNAIITIHSEKKISFTAKNIGRISTAIISSQNSIVALNNRNEMWLINLDKKESKKILESGNMFRGIDWSPDGKWIVYARHISDEVTSLFLYNVERKTTHELTKPEFEDTSPSFDPTGKYIYFLSFRDLKVAFDPLSFNLYFKNGAKPYAISLQSDLENPFKDWVDINADNSDDNEDEDEAVDEKSSSEAKEIESTKIDLEGIHLRCFASKIKPSKYRGLVALTDKLMLFAGKKIEIMKFNSIKLENIASDVHKLCISQNRKWMITWNDEKLRVLAAGTKGEEVDNSYKKGGWISLDDIEVRANPVEEWKQILNEVWWLTKEHFWNANLNNINWGSIKSKYQKLIMKIKSRNELNTILADMIGELKTSHAYVLEPGDVYKIEHKKHVYLGVQFEKVESGFKITKIHEIKSWLHDSPLGLKAKVGDIITHINGHEMKNSENLEIFLVPGNNTIILNGTKEVYIQPMKSWNKLSYQNWIDTNVKTIQDQSASIGYVHIPNMVESGFEEFYRRYLFEHKKAGLIVDARFNSGGFLSSLILDRLQRKRAAYSIPRHGTKEPYPSESPSGPMILLCNEYTGSDGDIFTRMFKELNLGEVIGKRTWGGVVGIMPRYYLIDGGLTSQPEFGISMTNGGLEMENQGVNPDVEIGISPEEFENNHDPQLEEAIKRMKVLIQSKL